MISKFTTLITAIIVFGVIFSSFLFLMIGQSYEQENKPPSLSPSQLTIQNLTKNVAGTNLWLIGGIIQYIAYPFLYLATIILYLFSLIAWVFGFFTYTLSLFPDWISAPFIIIIITVIITSFIGSIRIAGSGIK